MALDPKTRLRQEIPAEVWEKFAQTVDRAEALEQLNRAFIVEHFHQPSDAIVLTRLYLILAESMYVTVYANFRDTPTALMFLARWRDTVRTSLRELQQIVESANPFITAEALGRSYADPTATDPEDPQP